ncbi:MAG: metallophosphoesterase [Lachnospiraceae bacterium]|nr:metallophosphoesterase [Lachnospiraceae bacterium]
MLQIISIVILIFICFFLLIMFIDCNRFITTVYEIESKKISREFTFVLLSDLHNKSFGKQNERLLKAIDKLSPDAVITAGDIITAQRGEKYMIAAAFMEQLAAKYPVYYGMGNHEHCVGEEPERFGDIYEKYMEILYKAGIEPLINENVSLPSANIKVCGLQMDRQRYYGKFVKKAMPENYLRDILGNADRDSFQILIAHNPDYFEDYAKWGADLVVSGHVHGGLMQLPVLGGVISPRLTLFPKYDGGRFECGTSIMLLSRGLGTHTLPIRIFNPGELVFVRLRPHS